MKPVKDISTLSEELKIIKNNYGEKMMHFCRRYFSTILNKRGLMLKILSLHFAPTTSLLDDLIANKMVISFINWINSFWVIDEDDVLIYTDEDPFTLMRRAGYTLYECKTEEDIQGFRKYYRPDEVLCTIRNGGRLNSCYVFFAVKDNAESLNREDFHNPLRQDEYGTSVISIQISRGFHTVSIKNRYNDTIVEQVPDATFDNNLDNIISGLTRSLVKYLGIPHVKGETEEILFENLSYVTANDGRMYRVNCDLGRVSFCENNIIISDGKIIDEYAKAPERYIVMDSFILDLKEKRFILFPPNRKKDSFVSSIMDVGKINKITVNKESPNRRITIRYDDGKMVYITINKNNSIVSYENDYVTIIDDDFLSFSFNVENIKMDNVIKVGKNFVPCCKSLKNISLNNIQEIGNGSLIYVDSLETISLPQLEKVGGLFLGSAKSIRKIDFPKLREIGDYFMSSRVLIPLEEINLPCVEIIGRDFLGECQAENLKTIIIPKVKKIGSNFCRRGGMNVHHLELPEVREIDHNFMYMNAHLRELILPKVEIIGNEFMIRSSLKRVILPNIVTIGDDFLGQGQHLEELELGESLEDVGDDFLSSENERYRNLIFRRLWRKR